MLGRKWRVCYDIHQVTMSCAGSNYNCTKETYHGDITMVPTVQNVRKCIAEKFPAETIEETWMSLFEQIHDGLEYGMFSVSLKEHPNDNLDTRSVSFLEV